MTMADQMAENEPAARPPDGAGPQTLQLRDTTLELEQTLEQTLEQGMVEHRWAEKEPAARPSDGAGSEQDTALAAQQQQSELGAPGAGELPTTLLESQRRSRVE